KVKGPREINNHAGEQAEADQRRDGDRGQHAAPPYETLLGEENGIVVQVHINSFAPDCKKICSRSSPMPRHSTMRTPWITRVFSNPSSASMSPSKSNVAPLPAVSRFFTPAVLRISSALPPSARHFNDIMR